MNSFVYANVNCCPLVWHFSFSKSSDKMANLQERAPRYLHNYYISNYGTLLTL